MYGDKSATEEATAAAVQQDITLIVVLAVLVPLVLLLLVVVFRKFNRKDRQDGPMYEIAASDYPMPFYSDTAKKLKGLAPDLTQGVGMAPLPPTALPPCYDHARRQRGQPLPRLPDVLAGEAAPERLARLALQQRHLQFPADLRVRRWA